MRVAVVAPPWLPVPPTHYGGTEVVIDALCRGLCDLGDEVLLCASGDSECPVELACCAPAAAGTAAMDEEVEQRHVTAAYSAIRHWQPDIVHDHTVSGPLAALGLGKAPIVATNHGPFDGDPADRYASIARTASVVALSHDHAGRAGAVPIAAVIPHGLDLGAIPVGDGRGGYALFLGRMCPDKGVATAIEVARRAGVPLKIAAKMREPAEQEFFRDVIRPRLGDDVEYLGEAGYLDKLALLRSAVALVNPISWPEPFGLVMVEALACGTPVVATPCGSVPELVDDGVTGFIAGDVDGLAEGLASSVRLDRLSCRRAAEQRFSHQRMAARHHSVYERILHGDGVRPTPDAWLGRDDSGLLRVTVATTSTGTVVSPRGDIDHSTASRFADALRIGITKSVLGNVTVDLSAVDFVDAGGVRCLMDAAIR
ncbi:MAG: glycosyltransferase, partial [Acidimicrobiia bacterium]|nr:glycosyltransferase [Acidimicrobiia bacterium]